VPIDGIGPSRSCPDTYVTGTPAHNRSYHDQTNTDLSCLYTAYWIAFGPHGPRSLPPPGENKKVALYTFIGLGVSLALFATMRSFAKPGPSTMNKEWQEASNEFLKVGCRCSPRCSLPRPLLSMAANRTLSTEPKVGPVDGYLVGGIYRQGPDPIPLVQGVNNTGFLLSIDTTSSAGGSSCKASPAKEVGGDGALGVTGVDIGCKYCTTLTMRHLSLLPAIGSDVPSQAVGRPCLLVSAMAI
jgi:hypothetical protein